MIDLFDVGGLRAKSSPFVVVNYPGEPQAWQRAGARIVIPKSGGKPFIVFYTQKETEQHEAALRQLAALQMGRKQILNGAIAVRITATFSVPKSWTKAERDAALDGPQISKPDWDNIGKLLDAFKGVIWTDDCRVARALVVKQYGERPSLLIEVFEL